jgi:hypothetical protein
MKSMQVLTRLAAAVIALALTAGLAAAKDLRFPDKGDVAYMLHIGDDWGMQPDDSGNLILRAPGNFAGMSLSVIQDAASAKAPRDDVAAAILRAANAQPFSRHEPSTIGSVKAEAYYSTMSNANNVNLAVKLIIVQVGSTHVVTETIITSAGGLSPANQKILDDTLRGITLTGVK